MDSVAQTVANKPNDLEASEVLVQAQIFAQATLQKLSAATRETYADDGFQQLFREMGQLSSICLSLLNADFLLFCSTYCECRS